MNTGLPVLRLRHGLDHRVGDVGVRVRPGVDDFVVALAVRDVARLVRGALDARGSASSSSVSFSPGTEILDADRDTPIVALRNPNSLRRSRNATVAADPRDDTPRRRAPRAPSSSCRGSGTA